MKVKIQQRSVYHKFAEIEIEIDEDVYEHYQIDNGKWTGMDDYQMHNEHLWVDKIDHKINESEFVFGLGLDNDAGMDEKDSESEWRYEIVGTNYGGHL